MYFGSVKFFKHLIITVLVLLFCVPLGLCIWFGISGAMLRAENSELQHKLETSEYMVKLYGGEVKPNASELYKLLDYSGVSDEEILNVIHNANPDAFTLFIPRETSAPQTEPAIEAAATQTTVESPAQTTATTPAPVSDEEATTEEVGGDAPEEILDSPYTELYPDMYVEQPAEFVRNTGSVYLTFDDGPSTNTYSILKYLDDYKAKATFFVVPQRTDECYTILKQMIQSGHSVGVHSASHIYKDIYSSVEAWLADFYDAWTIIYEATGVKTQIFRFPGGSKNDYNTAVYKEIIEEMTRRGFRYYDWNVDSKDCEGATWTDMYYSVPKDITAFVDNDKRAVVLMHDYPAAYNTVLVLGDLLKVFTDKGWKLEAIQNNDAPVQFVSPMNIEY